MILLILLISCSSLPEFVEGCDGDTVCEEQVIQREDQRARRAERLRFEEASARTCWITQRGYYNKTNGRCMSRFELGME